MTARDELEQSDPQAPPWSQEAEQSVLGGLMLDNGAWDRAADLVEARQFFDGQHRVIFDVIGSMISSMKPADVITVFQRCQVLGRSNPVAEQVTMIYLNALVESVPSATNIRRYAEIVNETWRERVLIAQADEAMSIARSAGPAAGKLERIVQGFGSLERQNVRNVPRTIQDIMVERLDHLTALNEGSVTMGWTTGLNQVDKLLRGGFQPGRVYLLGGRPAQGKSALSLWMASNSALLDGLSSLYLSQEMPDSEVGERTLAMTAQVSYTNLQTGKLSDREWGKVSEGVEKLASANFHIDSQTGLSAGDIGIKVRTIQGVNLVVLDYVQLCRGTGEGENNRNGELEVISRALKQLAKDRNCAVIVLSALSRKVDERGHRRPIMSDFRDCGALEADCDVQMSLFQLRALDERGARIMGLDIIKNRQGPTGIVALDFWPDLMSWAESEYRAEDLLAPEKKRSNGGDL